MFYQWDLNGTNLPAATNSALTILNVQAGHQGSYAVAISNRYGITLSEPASLTVLIPPVVIQQPQDLTVLVGAEATFTVTVSNRATLPIDYQWRKASTILTNIILSAYTSSFTVHNVTSSDAGQYRVALTNVATTGQGVGSTLATMTVVTSTLPPMVTLTNPPDGATFSEPASIALGAAASDSDGSVARVEFYAGTKFLGSVTNPPYTLVWNNVAAGIYSLTARAFDNLGVSSNSPPVGIAVLPAQPLHIQTLTVTGSIATLTWSAQASRIYRVQYKTNLSVAIWNDLSGDIAAPGTLAGKIDATLGNASQRFYRVLQLP